MSGRLLVGRALAMLAVFTGLGYGVMRAVTPSDDEFYKSLAPDLQRKVDERRGKTAERERLSKIQQQKAIQLYAEPISARDIMSVLPLAGL
ncbi:hypothetical protein CROQUDRAFT_660478 [Cronartium quercuum f. sp. fusiforme G11]|uniref:Uncharacterized protein n=1 Tax=Cronartium quercuum f. sp. fusiforme G11 TaxID=708437 RepID=A0A9P6NDD1_9BASI|nr:hypothetical protein CROQUDRAFT_660478 [Cronartium quercuum f. sp. fusiforme G11]